MSFRQPTLRRVLLMLMLSTLLSGCRGLLFYPQKELVTTPPDWQLDYRDVELRAADGTHLHGWWLPARGEARATVYFLHGNAENISTHIASVAWLPARGFNVFLLDYRGYGRSEGEPDIPAIFADIEAGLAWVAAASGDGPLILLGQSLGASMGGYVVAQQLQRYPQLAAAILDAGFTGYRAIAREVASRSWLTAPFGPLVAAAMPENYNLIDAIGRYSPLPVLVIHGSQDQVIPPSHGEALFAAAGEPKSLLRYDGPHIATFGDRENRELVLQFVDKAIVRWREANAGRGTGDGRR